MKILLKARRNLIDNKFFMIENKTNEFFRKFAFFNEILISREKKKKKNLKAKNEKSD